MEHETSRAVSNVVGYALLFGIMTVTIATTSFVGGPAIQEAQQASADGITRDSMTLFASDIEKLRTTASEQQSIQMQPQGGHISLGQPTTITIETADGSRYTQVTRPLTYDSDSGQEIVYESGAVVTRQPSGSAYMTKAPPISIDDTVSVPLIVTTTPRDRSIQATRGSITATRTDRVTPPLPATTPTLTVSISSRYASAWKAYFDGLTASSYRITTTQPSPSTLTVTVERTSRGEFPVEVPVTEVSLAID